MPSQNTLTKKESEKPTDWINDCLTSSIEQEIEEWHESVSNKLVTWMRIKPESRIHSVRARIKDRGHLLAKVPRKNAERKKKNKDLITQNNFFEEVEDIAGARALVLYKHDLAILDHFIITNDDWHISSSEAKYDKNRPHDKKWFESLGFKENNKKRGLKGGEDGYTSIHYILVKSKKDLKGRPHRRCELQIRTIHEESWSEFSHQYAYPRNTSDELPSRLIMRLSSLLHLAEDLIADVRRSPIQARLLQELFEASGGNTIKNENYYDALLKVLKSAKHLGGAPIFAAVEVLNQSTSSSYNKKLTLISLGFDTPDERNVFNDELANMYLKAQVGWANSNDRNIIKLHISDNSTDTTAYREGIIHRTMSSKCFSELHKLFKPKLLVHDRLQFFLGLPEKEEENNNIKAVGFYSPMKDQDLLAGVIPIETMPHTHQIELLNYARILHNISADQECLNNPNRLREQYKNLTTNKNSLNGHLPNV